MSKKLEKFLTRLKKSFKFKKWSSISSGGFKTNRINQIRELLKILSGDEPLLMLNDIFKEELNSTDSKYRTCVENIGVLFKNNKQNKYFKPTFKRIILRKVKKSGIKHSEAFRLGFNASKYLWKKCFTLEPELKRGRKRLELDLVAAINKHLELYSFSSSSRTVKSDFKVQNSTKEDVPVQYRTETLTDLYETFDFKNELSFSCFYSYISNEFKKPRRLTDLCHYCENGRILKKKITEAAIKAGYINNCIKQEFNTQNLTAFFIELNKNHNQ